MAYGSYTNLLRWSYKRYLDRELRVAYDLIGTPIKFWFIEKHETHKHGTRPKAE